MNFDQLKSFVSVANTGSYSQAAKEQFISQPAISGQMKSLEEELGGTLFLKNGKKVGLSDKGREFYKYAMQMLSLEKDMLRSFQGHADTKYGRLDIAVPWLMFRELMDEFFVEAIQAKGKEVTYRILERDDIYIPHMVANGEIEIGVANHMLNNKNLVYEKAFTEEIVLVTPDQEEYRNLTPEKLKELLLTKGHIRYDFGGGPDFLWNDFFGKVIGCDLHNIKTVAYTGQYKHQLLAVEAGLGIGFVSTTCVQDWMREGRVLAYRCKGLLEKPHYVIYDKGRAENSEIIRYTKDLLLEKLRQSVEYPELSF